MQEEISEELKSEIARHVMQPDNYGKLEGANGVGIAMDQATNSYVVMYLKRDSKIIEDIKFGTNAMSQDVPTLGSIFTDMVKGDEIEDAILTIEGLEKELEQNYANLPKPKIDTSKPEGEQVEQISTEHQDSANMVLTSFRAAMRHYERSQEGIVEEYFEMNIAKTCPYSMSDCHFMEKESDQESKETN